MRGVNPALGVGGGEELEEGVAEAGALGGEGVESFIEAEEEHLGEGAPGGVGAEEGFGELVEIGAG